MDLRTIEPRRSDEPKLSFDEWVAELRGLYAEKLMSAKRRENKAVGPCPKCGVCGPSDFTVQEPVEALWCCGTERIDDGTIIQSDLCKAYERGAKAHALVVELEREIRRLLDESRGIDNANGGEAPGLGIEPEK